LDDPSGDALGEGWEARRVAAPGGHDDLMGPHLAFGRRSGEASVAELVPTLHDDMFVAGLAEQLRHGETSVTGAHDQNVDRRRQHEAALSNVCVPASHTSGA
jgi:hypothetical protein